MSAPDPYEALGVARDASADDIRRAYRQLAKKLHPDLNPGDAAAEQRFKTVSAAYGLLSDPDKRARFDRGEIDASGAEHPRERFYRDYADAGQGAAGYASDAGFADFAGLDEDELLAELFGRARRPRGPRRGADVRYRLEVEFLDAVRGATRRLPLPDGSVIDLAVPPGTRDGQTLRLREKGRPGVAGGPAGDALVEIAVRPHPVFTRDGDDIRLELPISLREAVLGARVPVPVPDGQVMMTLPKGAGSGRTLRLKGKGVPRPGGGAGDVYVTLKLVLPPEPDPELEAFVSGWSGGAAHDPRRGMMP